MQEKKDTVTTLSRAELLHENIKRGKKARALRRKKKKLYSNVMLLHDQTWLMP